MSTTRARVLVIDDDRPILLLMQRALQEFGFLPVIASSGVEALRLAAESRPDVVLLDMNMPGMSGREVIAALKTASSGAPPPVIILSGDRISEAQVRAEGAVGAIQKPFDLLSLVERIREVIGTGS